MPRKNVIARAGYFKGMGKYVGCKVQGSIIWARVSVNSYWREKQIFERWKLLTPDS
jgi:hypothetical protein